MRRRKRPRLNREQALGAKPLAAKIVSRKPLPNGGQRVTIAVHPRGIRKWLLRLPETIERQFELDPIGVELVQQCDGQKNVRYIVNKFASKHRLDAAEAEKAVTTFLQTLVRKGLLTMLVPK